MDFSHRGAASPNMHNRPSVAQAPAPTPASAPANTSMPNNDNDKNGGLFGSSKWLRVSAVALLFSLTIVAVGIVGLLYIGTPKEGKYVDTDQYQAVFLNNGQTYQVYFGHIKSITSNYIDLQNIFYLNNQSSQSSSSTSSSTTPTTLSLIKLGCEVHGPNDEMIINRSQVAFWENIRDNGQVGTAIATWKKDNPNGQTCTSNSSATQSTGSTSTTSSTTGTSSTGSTSTTTK